MSPGPSSARRAAPSIRLVVAAALVLPVLLVALGLIGMSTVAVRRIALGLGAQIVHGTTDEAAVELGDFLSIAAQVSDLNESLIARGELDHTTLRSWGPSLLDEMRAFDAVSFIVFANEAGETVVVARDPVGLLLGWRDEATGWRLTEWATGPDGAVIEPPVRSYDFDPSLRPWHRLALEHAEPSWSEAYLFAGERGAGQEIGLSYTRRIHDLDDEPIGVLAVDVTLGALSAYLRSLPLARDGAIFIVDDRDQLIAASKGGVIEDGDRLTLGESSSSAARLAVAALERPEASVGDLVRIEVDGEPARALVSSFAPATGIDWRMVAVLPERVYLSEATRVQTRLVIFSAAAVIVAVFVAIRLAHRIARPILRLREHVHRVGEGDLDARLDLHAAREFEDLSTDLNSMSGKLRQHLDLQQSMDVARRVQQSLLPKAPPRPPGLDLAGHTQYCDTTGGDYFDFIDMTPATGRDGNAAALVAVGDVMGHGMGSALLMATARAALRIQVNGGDGLGDMLTRVNDVLLQGGEHGRFMTMLLLLVNPGARRVRYANAGHDAALLYDPGTDRFTELEGGGIPLGVEEGTTYEEYVLEDLPPGAVLVSGTDGIWEMRNADGELFGKRPLEGIIREHAARSADLIVERIRDALSAHQGTTSAQDDVTFVVARLVPIDDRSGSPA